MNGISGEEMFEEEKMIEEEMFDEPIEEGMWLLFIILLQIKEFILAK